MEKKKVLILLMIVLVIISGIGIGTYIVFSETEKDEDERMPNAHPNLTIGKVIEIKEDKNVVIRVSEGGLGVNLKEGDKLLVHYEKSIHYTSNEKTGHYDYEVQLNDELWISHFIDEIQKKNGSYYIEVDEVGRYDAKEQ